MSGTVRGEGDGVSSLDITGLEWDVTGLKWLVMDRKITSSCCEVPVAGDGGDWICPECGQACGATQTLKVITLGEQARAVAAAEGNEDLSQWASFRDVAVAYGDRWAGPDTAEFGAILARMEVARQQAAEEEAGGEARQEYRVQVPVREVRAYEEFREQWHRERGLPVPDREA